MKDINTLIEEYFSNDDNFGLEEMVKRGEALKETNEAMVSTSRAMIDRNNQTIARNNRLIQENRAYLDALDATYN